MIFLAKGFDGVLHRATAVGTCQHQQSIAARAAGSWPRPETQPPSHGFSTCMVGVVSPEVPCVDRSGNGRSFRSIRASWAKYWQIKAADTILCRRVFTPLAPNDWTFQSCPVSSSLSPLVVVLASSFDTIDYPDCLAGSTSTPDALRSLGAHSGLGNMP